MRTARRRERALGRWGSRALLAAVCCAATLRAAAQPADPASAEPAAPAPPSPSPEPPPTEARPLAEDWPVLAPIEPSFPTPVRAAPKAAPEPQSVSEPVDPLAAALSFGPGRGVEILSADGSYALNLRLKGQFIDEFVLPTEEFVPIRNHFFVRRMRLAFAGHVFDPAIRYKVELTFAGHELNREPVAVLGAMPAAAMQPVATSRDVLQQSPLLDLYLEFTHFRDASLRIGQSKVTYGRERIVPGTDLHTVDRSIADQEFNFGRDMGGELRSFDLGGLDRVRYFLGVYAAEERNAGRSSTGMGDFGLLYFGRFELVPMGSFDESPVDFERAPPRLSLGAAYALVQADITSPYAAQSAGDAVQPALGRLAEVDFNSHNFTADFLFKAAGFSALGAFHYRKLADLPGDLVGRDGIGFTLQGHYLFSNELPLSVAANASMVRAIGAASAIEQRNEAGVGLGYYFYGHALKLEAEFEHLWRQAREDGAAVRAPDNRVRLQLSFMI